MKAKGQKWYKRVCGRLVTVKCESIKRPAFSGYPLIRQPNRAPFTIDFFEHHRCPRIADGYVRVGFRPFGVDELDLCHLRKRLEFPATPVPRYSREEPSKQRKDLHRIADR